MKKLVSLVLIFLMVLPTSVLADGAIWRYNDDRWQPLEENEQKAAINFQDGFQKMIIQVNFDAAANDNAVWIFPVPSSPQRVVIDILRDFPILRGQEPTKQVKSSVGSVILLSTLTQIYPAVLIGPFFLLFSGFAPFGASTSLSKIDGVTVHETIEKEGVTTEIITAETGNALYNYLTGQGLTLASDAVSIFDDYIGEEYSFVVSWLTRTVPGGGTTSPSGGTVSSYCDIHSECAEACSELCTKTVYGCCVEGNIGQCDLQTNTCYCSYDSSFCSGCPSCDYETQFCDGYTDRCLNTVDDSGVPPSYNYPATSGSVTIPYRRTSGQKEIGVSITFPTEKIYFPLMPTSIYGSTKIPITIYVMEHVMPDTYNDIRSYVKSEYYVSSYLSTGGLESFYGNIDENNVRYTKIEILDAPSKYFTQDLWFTIGAPINVGIATAINSVFSANPLLSALIIILLLSALAGAITGQIIFKEWRKYALIGLSNILSIIALAIVVMIVKSPTKISKDLERRLKKERVSFLDRKKFVFIPIYSGIYLLVCLFAYILIILL